MSKTKQENIHVHAKKLGKEFPGRIQALANFDLYVQKGQFVSIVGPSGCGKSTLLRLIAGLDPHTKGELTVDGQDPLDARQSRNNLAYVFQEATLLPWRTVFDNIALPLELRRITDKSKVEHILSIVGLSDFSNSFPSQLSGGMRMRVSIARALVTHPGLLLLDEPFGALDEITRQHLNEELLRLWERDRWTGIFVTHNVFEAAFLADRVLVMSTRPGKIVADIQVPFTHPRDKDLRHQSAFNNVAHEISSQLQRAHV